MADIGRESIKRKVVIVGAAPDRINNNSALRRFVFEGFTQVLGSEVVAESSYENMLNVVRQYQPKLVVCFGSCMPDECNYGPLRDLCDQIEAEIAFWLHDDPYEFDADWKAVNIANWLFSNDSWATKHHEHPRAHFLPMAASTRAHLRMPPLSMDRDIFFCGVAFSNRIQLFRDLVPYLTGLRVGVFGDHWPMDLPFARNERMSNHDWSDACARSLVTVNIGRNLQLANRRFQLDACTPGPRTFEAAMAGTVQLFFADSLEITDFFEPEKEILLFDDPRQFRTYVERLLDEPAWARRIALAAQQRAIRDHTYEARARSLLTVCGLPIREHSIFGNKMLNG